MRARCPRCVIRPAALVELLEDRTLLTTLTVNSLGSVDIE